MKQNDRLNRLPEAIKNEVLRVLKGWVRCYVFQNENTGKITVGTSIGLTKVHDTERCIAYFYNRDVYTPEEISKYSAEYWKDVQWY